MDVTLDYAKRILMPHLGEYNSGSTAGRKGVER
jgi:hypothetical protein